MSKLRSGEDGNSGTTPANVSRSIKLYSGPNEAWKLGDGDEALRVCASKLGVDLNTDEGRLEATKAALEADPSLALSKDRREAYLLKQNHRRIERELSEAQRKKLLATQELELEKERLAGFEAATMLAHAKMLAGITENLNPTTMSHDDLRKHKEMLLHYREAIKPQLNKLFGDED